LYFENEGNFFNYSIVNGYAPTEISDDEEKDRFFDALRRAYDISPRNYIKIVSTTLMSRWARNCKFFHNWQLKSSQSHKKQWIPADTVCSIA
jgi:hypothetical protein